MKRPTDAPQHVIKTMTPGQPGAVKLTRKYGHALVCVRYRKDAKGKIRYTTVELVVDATPIQHRVPDQSLVKVRIDYDDKAMRQKAADHGAMWDKADKVWYMTKDTARRLKLSMCILKA